MHSYHWQRIFLALSLCAILTVGILFLSKELPRPLFAAGAPGQKLSGWAWSSTIGWISFSCSNVLPSFPNGHCQAQGGIDYGVNVVLPLTGNFEKLGGYAWANPKDNLAGKNNIGWVTFNEADLAGCPQGPCSAQVNFTSGKVLGWARFCGVFQSGCSGALLPDTARGGWDGWIELSGTNHSSPDLSGNGGVTFDSGTCSFKGSAWEGDNADSAQFAGWIKFQKNPADAGPAYTVQIANLPPVAPTSLALAITYCNHPWIFNFSWFYSDPENDPQAYYQLQISNNGTFAGPDIVYDTNKTSLAGASNSTVSIALTLCSPSPILGCGASSVFKPGFDHDYWWRVKVWDNQSGATCSQPSESPWSAASTFHLPKHDYSFPSFSFSPAKPSTGETVTFTTKPPTFDTGSINQSYNWNFGDGTTANVANPTHTFTAKGSYIVSLNAADDVGSCSATAPITVYPPLPSYIEKAPQ